MKQCLVDLIKVMPVKDLYQAMFVDHVTGSLNRTAYEYQVSAGQYADTKAVAIIDLDSLKYINDSVGHREGDKHLQYLASKLISHFGYDNVYRLSGDEFLVVAAHGNNQKKIVSILTDLQRLYLIFSFGVAKTLEEADTRLSYNKCIRVKSGERVNRGEQPPWFGKIQV